MNFEEVLFLAQTGERGGNRPDPGDVPPTSYQTVTGERKI